MALRVGVCLAALVGACEGFVGPHLSGRFVSFVAPALRYSPGMHALGRWGFPAEWRRVEAGMAPHGSEGGGDAAAGNSTSIFERVGAFGNLRSGGGGFVPPDERPEEPNYSVKPASENSVLKSAAEGKGVFDDMQKKANFDDVSPSRTIFASCPSFSPPCATWNRSRIHVFPSSPGAASGTLLLSRLTRRRFTQNERMVGCHFFPFAGRAPVHMVLRADRLESHPSLPPSLPPQPPQQLVQFPCVFTIKVVGVRQGEFTEDILDAVGGVVGRTRDELKHSVRDNGKWRSITVEVPVQTSEQLYAVYEAVGKDPRVKFKF